MGDELAEAITKALTEAQSTDRQLLEALTLLVGRVYQLEMEVRELQSHFVGQPEQRDA